MLGPLWGKITLFVREKVERQRKGVYYGKNVRPKCFEWKMLGPLWGKIALFVKEKVERQRKGVYYGKWILYHRLQFVRKKKSVSLM